MIQITSLQTTRGVLYSARIIPTFSMAPMVKELVCTSFFVFLPSCINWINHSGSAHVSGKSVWPLSLIAQGITSHDPQEINEVLSILESTTNFTYFMHESFNIDEPSLFTREWFSWANSFFSEFVITKLDLIESR